MADVRSLLRSERASRRIKHPQAAYSPTGALQCQICKVQLKSEALWDTHLRSADHAARFQRLRNEIAGKSRGGSRTSSVSEALTTSKKRKLAAAAADDDDDDDGRKRARPTFGLPESFFEGRQASEEPEGEAVDEPVESQVQTPRMIKQPKRTQPQALPPDFFAQIPSSSTSIPSRSSAHQPPTTTQLDEDYAAFERDIAATAAAAAATTSHSPPTHPSSSHPSNNPSTRHHPHLLPSALTAPATIVAEPLTAAELAARSRAEASVQAKEKREEEVEGEKEDAQLRLEAEFEEMEGLEERVRRLRGRREAIARKLGGGREGVVEVVGERAGEEAVMGDAGVGDGDPSDSDGDEGVDDDEWAGWGFR